MNQEISLPLFCTKETKYVPLSNVPLSISVKARFPSIWRGSRTSPIITWVNELTPDPDTKSTSFSFEEKLVALKEIPETGISIFIPVLVVQETVWTERVVAGIFLINIRFLASVLISEESTFAFPRMVSIWVCHLESICANCSGVTDFPFNSIMGSFKDCKSLFISKENKESSPPGNT